MYSCVENECLHFRYVRIDSFHLSYPVTTTHLSSCITAFSGMRALNFVLENPRVDRTLLFNVKVIRVDKSDGKGGFVRGN